MLYCCIAVQYTMSFVPTCHQSKGPRKWDFIELFFLLPFPFFFLSFFLSPLSVRKGAEKRRSKREILVQGGKGRWVGSIRSIRSQSRYLRYLRYHTYRISLLRMQVPASAEDAAGPFNPTNLRVANVFPPSQQFRGACTLRKLISHCHPAASKVALLRRKIGIVIL